MNTNFTPMSGDVANVTAGSCVEYAGALHIMPAQQPSSQLMLIRLDNGEATQITVGTTVVVYPRATVFTEPPF